MMNKQAHLLLWCDARPVPEPRIPALRTYEQRLLKYRDIYMDASGWRELYIHTYT